MLSKTHTRLCALTCAAVLSGLPLGAQTPALTITRARIQVGAMPVEVELGVFQVAEFHARADSRRMPLHFLRLPTRSATPGPPIVYLAGGPGVSGIAAAGGCDGPCLIHSATLRMSSCSISEARDDQARYLNAPPVRSSPTTCRRRVRTSFGCLRNRYATVASSGQRQA